QLRGRRDGQPVVRGGVCPRWLDCGFASGTRVMVGRVRVRVLESAHQVTTPGAAAGRGKRSARASAAWLRERSKCSWDIRPPNNRLKLTARGRSVSESLRRTRAAA